MGNLMLNRDLQSQPSSTVINLARARTTTVIIRLDADGNRDVTRFLTDSQLTDRNGLLVQADLPEAKLRGAVLIEAQLTDTDLYGADLRDAFVAGANLGGANLSCKEVKGVGGFSLEGEERSCPDLRGADLRGADLRGADLREANLRGADLSDANVIGANLENANLSGADGITNAELAQQAVSLEGADMPNGQKYERLAQGQEPRGERISPGPDSLTT
jgi:uncharacterized protein YjbI with pentapeptide repeats